MVFVEMSTRTMPRSHLSRAPQVARMDEPSGLQPTAVSRGFLSSSSSIGTINSRAALATLMTYQPFLLLASRREPSRLKDTGENDSSSFLGSSPGLGSAGVAAASPAVSAFEAAGFGVRLRALPPSTLWTKI